MTTIELEVSQKCAKTELKHSWDSKMEPLKLSQNWPKIEAKLRKKLSAKSWVNVAIWHLIDFLFANLCSLICEERVFNDDNRQI